ncbi:MAG TPA: STAS domain-containing protein [Tenuifilaceae bacterium]|nr:STAS domain-containing protein [Tenuifilaceae bacterium]HPE17144.1 STAS domain-containing protein [Tenuifilaceae bacterium]HPJ45872.1 STAS domain-containing protein [Tenuifilaceae bacterium]HPQ34097.1 STAS domain-containing protein [Tenuifilaceae bacterium]HRX68732.1 STAS domain-containing protein [Tenuifilaceae bacterium]
MAKNQKFTFKIQQPKGKGKEQEPVQLTLQGDLSIETAGDIKKQLLENLNKYMNFNIKVSNVDTLDLTFVQVLQRFIWDAQQLKKSVVVNFSLPDDIQLLLEHAGFESFLKQEVNINLIKT